MPMFITLPNHMPTEYVTPRRARTREETVDSVPNVLSFHTRWRNVERPEARPTPCTKTDRIEGGHRVAGVATTYGGKAGEAGEGSREERAGALLSCLGVARCRVRAPQTTRAPPDAPQAWQSPRRYRRESMKKGIRQA